MAALPRIIIPKNFDNHINPCEIEAAKILLMYFNQDVEFLVPSKAYKVKTPDVIVGGSVTWEIKCPVGSSKKPTIERQMNGLKQSRNLLIDGRRCALSDEVMIRQIKSEMYGGRRGARVLFIKKDDSTLEIHG